MEEEKKRRKKSSAQWFRPVLLVKKLRRRRYGEVSAQTSQKSQNRVLEEKKKLRTVRLRRKHVPTNVDHNNRTFSKSEILAESLETDTIKKKKKRRKERKYFVL